MAKTIATEMTEQEMYMTPTEWSKYRLLYRMLDMANLPEEAYCCEIGCGAGIFLSYLEKKGFRALGIDLSEEAVRIASQRFKTGQISVKIQTIYDVKDKFDAVFLFEVLEHIADDRGFLKYISENLLKAGGAFFISVPARQILFSKGDIYYGHLRRYEKKGLEEMLRKAGLSPVLFWSFGLLPVHLICQHLLFKKFYDSAPPDCDMKSRTERSGLLEFPQIWKKIYPLASRFYSLLLFLEKAFLNLDIGYTYLAYCRKGAQ